MPADTFYPYSTGYVDFPGSSGYTTGQRFPDVSRKYWDPAAGMVRSTNPSSIQLPRVNVNGVNPYSQLLGYNPGQILARPTSSTSGGTKLPPGPQVGGGFNPAAPPGAGYNPFFTVANTKSPEIAGPINQLLGDWQNLRGLNPTNIVTDAMTKANPDYQKYLEQETGAVSQYYNGDVQQALDALRAQRKAAYAQATDRALGQLSRVLATNQMGQGGGGTVGTGSYISKQALDTAANLNAQAALDEAAQARADYNQVLSGQTGLIGQRAGLTMADINRRLLPSQVGANWFNTLVATLGPVAALQLQNTFYGLGAARNGGISFPGDVVGAGGGGVPNSVPIRLPTGGQPRAVSYGPGFQDGAPTGVPTAPTIPVRAQTVSAPTVPDARYGYWGYSPNVLPGENPFAAPPGPIGEMPPSSWYDSPSPIYIPQDQLYA